MAPIIATTVGDAGKLDFPGKLTFQVILCSLIAAFGGLIFGYDVGISGGVTSMDDFLIKFFPDVYAKKHVVRENNYCKYDNAYLQLFTSSLYIAAIAASYVASLTLKKFGRKRTLQGSAGCFFIGAVLNLFAPTLPSLIFGRMFLGAGVGSANQTTPLFISEIAPAKSRRALNFFFQLLIAVGILAANVVNYFTAKVHPHGWMISLGLAAIPGLLLLQGSIFIVETPASLVQRGKQAEARKTLEKIRGVDDVEDELREIKRATESAEQAKHSFRNLMKRESLPQAICGTIIHLFQQFTGINVIMFYAPVIFQTMGFGGGASLFSAVITGACNLVATIFTIFLVDKIGRKVLFVGGGIVMIIAQAIVGVILGMQLHSTNAIGDKYAVGVVFLVCVFVFAYAGTWGPLCWCFSSEIYPLESRNAGYFLAVSMNMFCTFLIAQTFLRMLCAMRAGIFFFFVACLVISNLFVIFMIPETKGVPIEDMVERVWKKHWLWRRFYDDINSTSHKEMNTFYGNLCSNSHFGYNQLNSI